MTDGEDLDIRAAIAALGPDLSWVDNVPMPSLDEIRERVRNHTPEQRAEAERAAADAEAWRPTDEAGKAARAASIARVVEAMGPLTPEQRHQLALLLPPVHRLDGERWTCLRCGRMAPDPCDCVCHSDTRWRVVKPDEAAP